MSTAPVLDPPPLALGLAAAGPAALGAVIGARVDDYTFVAGAPAIILGVIAATGPALYIALAATGDAPPIARVARAFAVALGAFGIALAGLIVPAAFLSLSSVDVVTAQAAVCAAIGAAALLGLLRLWHELGPGSASGLVVFLTWALAASLIAMRLWYGLSLEVVP